ncbi:MAG TPA: tetratricopeptide repeat protein [Polyangiaceae bacterium]|nr:tetratricopeptide repeat protein [Polyangiaceae bacterium]
MTGPKPGPVTALACIALVLFGCKRTAEPAPSASAPPPVPPSSAAETPTSARVTVAREPNALRASFIGSTACAPCHRAQAEAYAKSHHALALVPATADAVAAKLDGSTFATPLGKGAHFSRKDATFSVTTPDASGAARPYPIAYAAGVFPLQQYIVPTERGKLQTLGASWDTRALRDGGQRWFHLYGPKGIAPGDELYFTRPAQNWNHVCADCHSTLVERRYDVNADAFDTRWAELAVGCEACHGPGAEHVRRAKLGETAGNAPYAASFTVRLTPAAPWAPSATGSPTPRARETTEVEVCAPCHSRRQPLREGFVAGDPLLDAFEPELLSPGRHYADGQVEGEVYEWASFLQSKMHASGVRCSDCHEPHAAELRAPGNALCTRCHAPDHFDTTAHTHHAGDKAPHCVDCHMPPATFMQIDERRDHSIRIPRPDLSVEFGTPNACTGCHRDQSAAWAAAALSEWRANTTPRPHFVNALGRARRGDLDAARALRALGEDVTAPAIARATALERLGQFPSPKTLAVLRAALGNEEPLVVFGAALGASALPLAERAPLLMSVLEHPRRAIRIAAAKGLAELPLAELEPAARGALERAFAEVEASFAISASRPETHVEQSSFELARGKTADAARELDTALRLSPCFAEAHLNRADLARAQQDEAGARRELEAALKCAPRNAFAEHALGLWLVRNGKPRDAITHLKKAVELAPGEARFGYVLAVALADGGDAPEAVKVLESALTLHPNDRSLLQALASYLQKLDQKERASEVTAKLAALARD